ncbi:class I SAM-dependent methyltransferase, partial [Buchnera aphidicola]|nr:class I SAM-dependent methyltransferase [Buchnera aphidicola]
VVLDGTAGLGKDAFILSFLGCTVYMIERNPVIAALLQDGLERAYENEKIGSWIKKRLHLIYDNSVQMLNLSIIKPDVIYLDPMYPDKKKSLPKKDMQIFQKFIGRDSDLNKLLKKSRQLAKKRVIVKRPYHALPLSNATVNFVIYTKQHRFDIYHPF